MIRAMGMLHMPAFANNNNKWAILTVEVERLLSVGAETSASKLLHEYLDNYPNEPMALRALGRIKLNQGKPEEAATLLKRALQMFEAGVSDQEGAQLTDETIPIYSRQTSVVEEEFDDIDFEYVQQGSKRAEEQRTYFDPIDKDELIIVRGKGEEEIGNYENENIINDQDKLRKHNVQNESILNNKQSCKYSSTEDNESYDDEISLQDIIKSDLSKELDLELEDEEKLELDIEIDELDFDESEELSVLEKNKDPDVVIQTPSSDSYEWDSFDDDLLESGEVPTREDVKREIKYDGRISKKQRAQQVAIILGEQYGWDRNGIDLLTEVFSRYWWSSAKRSMIRELEAGLKPDELRLAIDIREIWHDHCEFSLNLHGYSHWNLSWPVALEFVRSFRGYPEPEEMQVTLENMYDEWYGDCNHTGIYCSFRDFIKARIQFPNEQYFTSPEVSLSDGYEKYDDDYFLGEFAGFNTPYYEWLVNNNLIPNFWVDSGSSLKIIKPDDQVDEN